jgi:hypothetical protein
MVPPVRPKTEEAPIMRNVKPEIGLEETELNYVIMAFIAGVMILAVSDSIRA